VHGERCVFCGAAGATRLVGSGQACIDGVACVDRQRLDAAATAELGPDGLPDPSEAFLDGVDGDVLPCGHVVEINVGRFRCTACGRCIECCESLSVCIGGQLSLN